MTQERSIGLVGTGYFAQFHARAWQRLPGARLAGVVAEDHETGTAFVAAHATPANPAPASPLPTDRMPAAPLPADPVPADHGKSENAALDEPISVHDSVIALAAYTGADIVDLVTPPASHRGLIRECIIAGVPLVVCQKPFCKDLAEAERLVNEIEGSNTTVLVHENFRFQPWYQEIRQLLSRGALGTLYSARFDLRPGDGQGKDAYLARQPYFRDQPEFLIHETGIHLVDVFRYLFGEVSGLFARLTKLNPVIRGEDAGIVLFDFIDGVRATLDGNRLADHAADNPRLVMGEMTVEGSDGTLRLDGDGQIRLRRHGERAWRHHGYAFDDVDFGGDCVYRYNAHVLDHLNSGSSVFNTAAEYLTNRRLESLIYRSHDQARWLEVEEFA